MIRSPADCPGLSTFRFDLYLAADAQGARKRDRTRAELRIATCRFLDANPLSTLTVAGICKAAGVAHGTFYLYFSDRGALVADLLAGFVEFTQRVMRASGRLGTGNRIHAVTQAYYSLYEQNRGLMKCLVNYLDDFPEAQAAFQKLNREWIGTVVTSVRRHRPDLSLSDEELTRRAYALGGMVDQYLCALLLNNDPALATVSGDRAAVVATLVTLWQKGFEE